MKKFISVCTLLGAFAFPLLAQEEEESKLKISGAVDAYYKYDFSGNANIGTSFANEQNSFSLGMLDLKFEKASGKASFVGEISFGPRNRSSVGPGPKVIVGEGEKAVEITDYIPNIQNLYVSYAFTDKFSVTGGYLQTFVGYELIGATGNFNYSTSYLFTNGPFQNAGIKFDYAFNDRFSVMAGVFNGWNLYTADPELGPTTLGAQVKVAPVEGWNIYLNTLTGKANGTIVDLTTSWQVTDKLLVGLNAASYNSGADTAATAFGGGAAYLNVAVADPLALGLRYEYFMSNAAYGLVGGVDGNINALTLSANIGSGDLTLIPELRLDMASESIFKDASGNATKNAFQALVAAVYSF
ncbi:MAG: porin [Bacteroidetes bacterium]|nr:MAG: porin [Bacteroidota bacterium]